MSKKLSVKTRKYIQLLRNEQITEGGSIMTQLNSLTKTIHNKIGKPIMDYGNAIVHGRNDYPPKVRQILRNTQHIYIKSITIKKSPVPALITGAMNVFSLGKFGKRLERSFDELFHLYIEIVLENNDKYLLEKNEVINMESNPKNKDNSESKQVTTQIPHLTINDMLENTEKNIGSSKFYGYSARDNNCQDFIVNLFKSNNIGNDEDINFIKQDTKQLFNNMPSLRKLSNSITDLGAAVNVITTGKGISEIHNYSDILKHLTGHIMDANEPIDNLDYKQAINMIKLIKHEKLKGGKLYIHHYHHIIDGTGQHHILNNDNDENNEDYNYKYKGKNYYT